MNRCENYATCGEMVLNDQTICGFCLQEAEIDRMQAKIADQSAEIERLHHSNDKLREIASSLKDQNADYFAQVTELEQERDQLKALSLDLCELVENNHGLPPTKWARYRYIVNQLRTNKDN